MSDTPAICFKPASVCVPSFELNGHRYDGCTAFDPNPAANASQPVDEWCSHVTHYVWGSKKWSYCLKVPCMDAAAPSTLFTPEGMTRSVLLNVFVLVTAVVILYIWVRCNACAQRLRRRATTALLPIAEDDGGEDHQGPELHSTARNYLVFLRNTRDMFVVLTLVSFLSSCCIGKQKTFLFGCVPGPISLMEDATATSLTVVCINALVLGMVVYVFVVRFERHCAKGHKKIMEDLDLVERTLWLTQLPCADSQTREPFRLSNEELEQVEKDLADKIRQDLIKKKGEDKDGIWQEVDPDQAIENLFVTPVVDNWHTVVNKIKKYDYLAREYRRSHSKSLKRGCQCLRRYEQKWLERQENKCQSLLEQFRDEAKFIEKDGPKELSGSAFVVFRKDQEDALRCLAGPEPGCLSWRRYTYWRFGRAPFSSVTLRCEAAPHPTNLNWENLKISETRRVLGYVTGRLFLFFFMLVLVTPVAVTSQLNLALHILQQHTELVEHWISRRLVHVKLASASTWQHLAEQLPTIALVLINSLVLPPIIGLVADWQRCHLKSREEKVQLHLNYLFLVLNQIAIPLLGLSGLPALAIIIKEEVGDVSGAVQRHSLTTGLGWAEACLAAVFSSPAAFSIKYLLNCAFMTGANSLLNLPQILLRGLMREAEPWNFSYGYWYAFSMGILALGFGMGIYVPSLLPCGFLFFAIRYEVDRYNISTRAYGLGLESLGSFSRSVQRMLKTTVSVWWVGIGAGVLLYLHTFFENNWDAPVPRVVVKGMACCLLVMGFLIVPVVVICDAGKSAGLPMEVSGFDGPQHSPQEAAWGRFLTNIFGQLHPPGIFARSRDGSVEPVMTGTTSLNSASLGFGYKHTPLQPKDWDVKVFLKLTSDAKNRSIKVG